MGEDHQVMDLTEASREGQRKHQEQILELEARKISSSIDVPTLRDEVRDMLRNMGEPVRLFGENLAEIRQRLRMVIARQKLGISGSTGIVKQEADGRQEARDEEEITKYTQAPSGLVEARQKFIGFSMNRAAKRLAKERTLKDLANRKRKLKEKNEIDESIKAYGTIKNRFERLALFGSQYGDDRALSCVLAGSLDHGKTEFMATSSWTGSIQCWDTSTGGIEKVAQATTCHEDRIMNMAILQSHSTILATASLDKSAKLWKIDKDEDTMNDNGPKLSIKPLQHLQGHSARLSQVAFHPMKEHVATTSYDYSWRLWDIETGSELLLQDGHWKESYGIDFHPDGSLCATSDFASVIQLWDLRSGKSIKHFLGHAKRVLHTAFHPNGFQLATAGDDGTVKIWDLRQREQFTSIPAHNRLVSSLRFHSSGEVLTSASFDGSVKVWSCRDWKLITSLQGHEGNVSHADYMNDSIISCGWDRTLKLWC